MDGSDRFVVTWENLNPDGTASVLMRYYNALGSPLTGITQVSAPGSTDYQPDVALSNGSFVITWAHHFSATDDDIYAERYVISNGVPQGQGIFVVNADGNSEAHPSVAMQQNGIFDIAYERQFSGSDWDILASQYDGNGALVRGDVHINFDASARAQPEHLDGQQRQRGGRLRGGGQRQRHRHLRQPAEHTAGSSVAGSPCATTSASARAARRSPWRGRTASSSWPTTTTSGSRPPR